MIDALKNLFSSKPAEPETPEITTEVAAAALMVEAALADGVVSDVEHQKIARILREGFKMDDAKAEATLETAQSLVESAVDHHKFTRVVKTMSHGQRKTVMTHLWMVALIDGHKDDQEDALLRRLAPLLALSDRDRAEARQHAANLVNPD